MKRHFTIDELSRAQHDSALLGELIASSCGYALVRMKKENLLPSLPLLMECLSGDSIMFILDNYALDREAQKKMAPFFKRSMSSSRLGGALLDEESVEALLLEGEMLAQGTVLSLRQMRIFPEQINALYAENDAAMDAIVCASMAKLSFEEALSLDPAFHQQNLHALCSMPGFFDDAARRSTYMKLALSRADRGGAAPRWSEFETWPFEASERAFLIGLISTKSIRDRPSYVEIAANASAAALVSPSDFFNAADAADLSSFTIQEVADSLPAIRSSWLSLISAREFPTLFAVQSFKCDADAFELIVDAGFVSKALALGADASPARLGEMDRLAGVRREVLAKAIADYLLSLGGEACARDAESSKMVPEIISLLTELSPSGGQLQALAAKCCAQIMPSLFSLSNIENFASFDQGWSAPLADPATRAAFVENASPNMLCWALFGWEAYEYSSSPEKKRFRRDDLAGDQFFSLASEITSRLSSDSAASICQSFNFPLPAGFVSNRAPAPASMDFLQTDYGSFQALGWRVRNLLVRRDAGFFAKFEAAGSEPDDELLVDILRQGAPLATLLAQLVERFPEAAQKSCLFYEQARAKGLFLEILSARKDVDEEALLHEVDRSVESMLILEKSIARDYERIDAAFPQLDWDDGGSEDLPLGPWRDLADQCSELSETLAAQRRSVALLAAPIAVEKLAQRARDAISQRRYGHFQEFQTIALRRLGGDGLGGEFQKHARSLGVGEFIEALASEPIFADAIKKMASWDGVDALALDFGSKSENLQAAMALLGPREDPEAGILFAFSTQARASFANELIANHLPAEALYSDYLNFMRGSSSSRVIPVRPFTIDEALHIWDSASSAGLLFSNHGPNSSSRLSGFFRCVIGDDAEIFSQLVDHSRTRPMLHCLLASYSIASNFETETPRNISATRDERHMLHVCSRFDWSILLRGVESVFETLREHPHSNKHAALAIVDSVTWASHFVDETPTGQIPRSTLSQETSFQLLDIFCRKAPAQLYSLRQVGCISILDDGPRLMLQSCGEDALEILALPPDFGRAEHCRIFEGTSHANGRAAEILGAACSWIVSESRSGDIELLDWLIKSRAFKSSELSYRHSGFSSESGLGSTAGECLDLIASTSDLRSLIAAGMERLEIAEIAGDNGARRRKAFRM